MTDFLPLSAEVILSSPVNSTCIICLRTVDLLNEIIAERDQGYINKYLIYVQRHLCGVSQDVFDQAATKLFRGSGFTVSMGTCTDCSFLVKDILDLYHEMKLMEMCMNWKLERLRGIMTSAEKIPSIKFRGHPKVNEKWKEKTENAKQFRIGFLRKIHLCLKLAYPKVRLQRCKNDLSVSNEWNSHMERIQERPNKTIAQGIETRHHDDSVLKDEINKKSEPRTNPPSKVNEESRFTSQHLDTDDLNLRVELCVFCFEIVLVPNDLDFDKILVKRLFHAVDRYYARVVTDCSEKFLNDNDNDDALASCKNCSLLVKQLLDSYDKLILLEIKMNWKLEMQRAVITSADRVPSRRKCLRKNLSEKGDGYGNVENVRKFRIGLVQKISKKLRGAFPKVRLERCKFIKLKNNIQPPEQLEGKSKDIESKHCKEEKSENKPSGNELELKVELLEPKPSRSNGTGTDGETHKCSPMTFTNTASTFNAGNTNLTNTNSRRNHINQGSLPENVSLMRRRSASANAFEIEDYDPDVNDEVMIEIEDILLIHDTTDPLKYDDNFDDIPGGNPVVENHARFKNNAIGKRYTCSKCGKTYSTSSNLSRHKQIHQSKNVKRCPTCGKAYLSRPALSMHLLTHNLSHKCNKCGKRFARSWLLQSHIRTHTGERPYECVHCGKAFADRSNLRAHVQSHSSAKMYTCHQCNKGFAVKSHLKKHINYVCCKDSATQNSSS